MFRPTRRPYGCKLRLLETLLTCFRLSTPGPCCGLEGLKLIILETIIQTPTLASWWGIIIHNISTTCSLGPLLLQLILESEVEHGLKVFSPNWLPQTKLHTVNAGFLWHPKSEVSTVSGAKSPMTSDKSCCTSHTAHQIWQKINLTCY